MTCRPTLFPRPKSTGEALARSRHFGGVGPFPEVNRRSDVSVRAKAQRLALPDADDRTIFDAGLLRLELFLEAAE